MNKKLLYVGHSYHVKTMSTVFIIDFLKCFYDVDVLADETWNGGKKIDIDLYNNYEIIVFFQYIPTKNILEQIETENIIFFPMYDGVAGLDLDFWYQCKKIKIINFSKTLHTKLKNWGFNSIYIQYFPDPVNFSPGNAGKVFFWQRLNHININTVSSLLKNYNCSIHIHKAVDPFHKFKQPSTEYEEKYKITYSEWFDTREEKHELIKEKGIYIAPREYEGIGMSFLEAMAMGKCVIANNKATMNEYIIDGYNGYLFELDNPKPIDFSDIKTIQKNAYEYMQEGYKKWTQEKIKIIDFIESENKNLLLNTDIIMLNSVEFLINQNSTLKNEIYSISNRLEKNKYGNNWIKIFGIYNNKERLKIVIFGISIVIKMNEEKINKIAWFIPIRKWRDNFRKQFQ